MTCERMKKCANGDYCNYHVGFLVSGCMNFKEKKPLTNEEWFDTLSTTEEKAEAIYECVMANSWSFSKDGIKRWLKQPHHESVTNCNE